jgi:hypothetical protein
MRVSYKLLIIIIVILLVITGETAKLDDDDSEMIEALVLASLLSKNLDDDNTEWGFVRRIFHKAKKAAVGCARSAACRGAVVGGAKLLFGRKK